MSSVLSTGPKVTRQSENLTRAIGLGIGNAGDGRQRISRGPQSVAQVPCRGRIDFFPRLSDEPVLTACQAEAGNLGRIREQRTQRLVFLSMGQTVLARSAGHSPA